MGVTVNLAVQVPLTMLDAQGNGTVLQATVGPGRSSAELKITLTADELTSIAQNGGVVYLMGGDLNAAAAILARAAELAAAAATAP